MGTSWPIMVSPPDPRYCPVATSWKNIGIPHANMAMKYMSKKVPGKRIHVMLFSTISFSLSASATLEAIKEMNNGYLL